MRRVVGRGMQSASSDPVAVFGHCDGYAGQCPGWFSDRLGQTPTSVLDLLRAGVDGPAQANYPAEALRRLLEARPCNGIEALMHWNIRTAPRLAALGFSEASKSGPGNMQRSGCNAWDRAERPACNRQRLSATRIRPNVILSKSLRRRCLQVSGFAFNL